MNRRLHHPAQYRVNSISLLPEEDNIPDYFDKFSKLPIVSCQKPDNDHVHQKWCVDRFFKSLNSGERLNMFLHDMKGGYLKEDCGSSVCYDVSDTHPFIFPLIAHSDAFVYFSHKTVSLPPRRWIEESHNHGKVVLGTILFENNTGEHTELFASNAELDERLEHYARLLTELMTVKCFDGYLINVEVKLTPPEIDNLLKFINLLKSKIRLICQFEPIIVWYDAVTAKGDLAWQDAVTANNKIFFEKCGLILLNYCWKAEQLQKTDKIVSSDAKNRVFVGIDIFARNTVYPSGSKGCAAALAMINKYDFSAGVFAPGYHREVVLQPKDSGFFSAYDYWKPIFPYLRHHPFLFTGTFSMGQYFKKSEQVEGSSQLLEYTRNHVYPLCPSNGSNFALKEDGIRFLGSGRHLLQTVEFRERCTCYLSLKGLNGILSFENADGTQLFTNGKTGHKINFPMGITYISVIAKKDDFFEGMEITRCDFLDSLGITLPLGPLE